MLNKLFSLKGRVNRSLYWFIPILSWFVPDILTLITSSITNNFPLQISLLLIVCLFIWLLCGDCYDSVQVGAQNAVVYGEEPV